MPRTFSFVLLVTAFSTALLPLHDSFVLLGVLPQQGIKLQPKAAPGAYPYSLLIRKERELSLASSSRLSHGKGC